MKAHFPRLEADEFFDQVDVIVAGVSVLRLVTVPRFKTSGLSGDEWRTSVIWRQRMSPLLDRRNPDYWEDLDGPYHGIDTACAAIYPGILTSHPEWHTRLCLAFEFSRKGTVRYVSSYDGQARPLLVALGALPWALIQARSGEGGGLPLRPEDDELCFQPGCSEPGTSLYRLKSRYCRHCGKQSETAPVFDHGKLVPGQEYRRFCQRHLERGDCGLDDADANYEVVEGPGPREAKPNPSDESPSVFGGVVTLP